MALTNSGSLSWGALARYALTEQFGEHGAGEAGIEAGGYLRTSEFSAGLIGGVVRLRLGADNVFSSDVRLVAHAGTVLTASATSLYAGGGFRWRPAVRISAFAMVDYVAPFQDRKNGPDYGGVAPQLGLGFVWP